MGGEVTPRTRIPELHGKVAATAGAPWPNGRTEVGNDVAQHVGDFFPEIAMPIHKGSVHAPYRDLRKTASRNKVCATCAII